MKDLSRWFQNLTTSVLSKSPRLRETLYALNILIRPTVPHEVGISFYQQASSWNLWEERCPCDVEFLEYMELSKIEDKCIFHFGTGQHHIVGLKNSTYVRPNQILGITASLQEHLSYTKLILKNPKLGKFYKVLFADIYTLSASILPSFDIVSLFHLGEFYIPENADIVLQNDESLLQLFISKLSPNGRIFFYTGSNGWDDVTHPLIESLESVGVISKVDSYKHLIIYAKSS